MRNKSAERNRKRLLETNRDAAIQQLSQTERSADEEREENAYLVNRVLQMIESDFQPATWRAFSETALKGRDAASVAAEFGMTVNAVYAARFRVLSRLRQEMSGPFDEFSRKNPPPRA